MIYRFADCEINTTRFELRRRGAAQKIEPQVFEVLRYLVERQGQFVGKEELYKAIWQNRVVSDATMSSRLKAARRAIGDNGTEQRLIRTVHGRGLSFVAPVSVLDDRSRPEPNASVDAEQGDVAAEPPREVLLSAEVHLNELLNGDGPASTADVELLAARAMLRTEIERAGGRIAAEEAGGVSARFGSEVEGLECAASLQRSHSEASGRTGDSSAGPRVGLCEILDSARRTAAIAERLHCLAAPGEICATGQVARRVQAKYRFATRPIETGAAHDLNELGPVIVEASGPQAESERPGIPQLQCGPPVRPREPSMVILPFDALGNEASTSELAEGLRIDIQNAFAQISRILLIAAASANAFRGKSPELAARSLGVRYVLHGVVRLAEKRARVNLELVDALSSQAAWTEVFDLMVTDPFTVQDEITRKVIAALDVKLYSGEQARIWHQALSDPEAVRMFYRGVRLFFRMDREAMAEARRAFETLAQMRPESSIGATWTALSHWIDYMRRWSGDQSESKQLARKWAEAAIPLPDTDGQAHTVLAHVRLLDRDFDAALEAGRQAVTIRPGCANANGFYGNVLHYCGEQPLAITHVRKGIRRQPIYPPFFACVLASAYLAAGQPESARAAAKEALRLNPRDIQARLLLIAAGHRGGNRETARSFAREILQLEPGFSIDAYCSDQPYRHRETIDVLRAAWLTVNGSDENARAPKWE